jgi:CDP-diacylglycerol--glycerol-3-phosphate 3-phosphatidyltransferase
MTTANKITIVRILLVPVFMVFMLSDAPVYITAVIFLIAASTDGLDGYVARKYRQVTTFGKFIDPLADKLLVTAALLGLVWLQKLSPWLALIIISREFIVTSLRIIAISCGKVIPAAFSGKVKTLLQIIAIIAMLSDKLYVIKIGPVHLSGILMGAAVIATLYSGFEYIIKNRALLRQE